MIGLGRVGGQSKIGEDRAEKQPGAEFARDEIGVLALPAKAGGAGERLLHDRRGVDEHFHLRGLGGTGGGDPAGQKLQPPLHDVVIVAIARVDGDDADASLVRAPPADRPPAHN